MQLRQTQKIRLGFFFLLSIVLLVVTIYYLGKEKFLFRDVITVNTFFNDIKGLMAGNNVRYLGMEAGTVAEIDIVNDSSVRVTMHIDESYTSYIKKDAKAQIESEGVMGSKVITILPGTPGAETIEENDVLASVTMISMEGFVNEASTLLTKVQSVTQQFVEISQKINEGKGDIGILLNEDRITTEISGVSQEMQGLANQLNNIFYKINQGDGDVAQLINEDNLTTQLNNIFVQLDTVTQKARQLSENLGKTTETINKGPGTVHKLLYDSTFASSLDVTLKKVNTGLEEITTTAESIDNSWIINLFSKDKKNKKKDNAAGKPMQSGN